MLPRRFSVLLLIVLFTGCATHPDYATQFRFPINWGNIEEGRVSFIELQCHQCHTVNGVDLPDYAGESPLKLELGGEITYAKTYADLVTSIINPNHIVSDKYLEMLSAEQRRRAQSIMPLKDEMTVGQLIDVVTFLNSRYILLEGYEEIYYR
jgi:hypothetical protein